MALQRRVHSKRSSSRRLPQTFSGGETATMTTYIPTYLPVSERGVFTCYNTYRAVFWAGEWHSRCGCTRSAAGTRLAQTPRWWASGADSASAAGQVRSRGGVSPGHGTPQSGRVTGVQSGGEVMAGAMLHGRRKRRGRRVPRSRKISGGRPPRNCDIPASFFLTHMKIVHFPPFSK